MQYFTKRALAERPRKPGKLNEYNFNWQDAYEKYLQQLTRLRDRLSVEAYMFFAEADLHDRGICRIWNLKAEQLASRAATDYRYSRL